MRRSPRDFRASGALVARDSRDLEEGMVGEHADVSLPDHTGRCEYRDALFAQAFSTASGFGLDD